MMKCLGGAIHSRSDVLHSIKIYSKTILFKYWFVSRFVDIDTEYFSLLGSGHTDMLWPKCIVSISLGLRQDLHVLLLGIFSQDNIMTALGVMSCCVSLH